MAQSPRREMTRLHLTRSSYRCRVGNCATSLKRRAQDVTIQRDFVLRTGRPFGDAVMVKLAQVGVIVALFACAARAEVPAAQKVTVEFRWIEPEIVKGVTEDKGNPIVCGG